MSLLKHIYGKIKVGNVVFQAIKYGQMHILDWYSKKYTVKGHNTLTNIACERGHVLCLDWLYENTKFTYNKNSVEHAIDNGHVSVIEWFHQHNLLVIKNYNIRDVNVMQWFVDNTSYVPIRENIRKCCNNNIPMLNFLYTRGFIDRYKYDIRMQVRNMSLRYIKSIDDNILLKWTKDHHFIYDVYDIEFYLRNDLLHVIDILRDNNMLIIDENEIIKNYILKNPSKKLIEWATPQIMFDYYEKIDMYKKMFYDSSYFIVSIHGLYFIGIFGVFIYNIYELGSFFE